MVIQQLVAKYQRRKWLSKSEQIKMQGAIFFLGIKVILTTSLTTKCKTNQKVE